MNAFSRSNETPLQITDLGSSNDEDVEEDTIVQDIGKLRHANNDLRKEKNRINIQIEGLRHDLQYAIKVKEVGDANYVSITRRLSEIFGKSLNEDALCEKIKELQERSNKTKKELNNLENLKKEKDENQIKLRLSQVRDGLSQEKQFVEEEHRRNKKRQIEIEKEILLINDQLSNETKKYEKLIQNIKISIGCDEIDINQIYSHIENNSDKKLNQICASLAEEFDFEYFGDSLAFIHDLRHKIESLKVEDNSSQAIFSLSASIQKSLVEISSINERLKNLRSEYKRINEEYSKEMTVIPQFDSEGIEKQEQEKENRIKKFSKRLKKSMCLTGFDIGSLKTYKDIQESIENWKKFMEEKIIEASVSEEKCDIRILNLKVDRVKKQNKNVRKTIKRMELL